MRALLLIVVGFLTSASPVVQSGKNYHDAIGFPLAKKIKAVEDALMNSTKTYEYRILQGEEAPDNAHPYMAGLIASFWNYTYMMYEPIKSVCGASLLSSNRLVTAAHCWNDGVHQVAELEVILGTSMLYYGGVRSSTSNVITHKYYDPVWLIHDIAMIFLPTDVYFTESIQPIALPLPTNLFENLAGEWVVAVGYGKISNTIGINRYSLLRHVRLLVITQEECSTFFSHNRIQPSLLCTNGFWGTGTCHGDSGSPLILYRNDVPYVVGITSFGSERYCTCECRDPSVFTRITSHYDFIQMYM